MKMPKKKYVDVVELVKQDGTVQLVKLFFDDEEFIISSSRFLGFRQGETGSGKCYEVVINDQTRYVYLEKDKYFVDAMVDVTEF